MARDPDLNNRGHIDPGNPDPINAWRPGSVADQRSHITQAEMGPVPDAEYTDRDVMPKAKPEREGPDYAAEEDFGELPALSIHVNIPTRERTMHILHGPAHEALRHFMRMQQQYQDTDQALGAQGQFSEIYHDTAKLKRMIWDRRNPQSVTVDEVTETLKSLIGHALLAMNLIQEGNKDGK